MYLYLIYIGMALYALYAIYVGEIIIFFNYTSSKSVYLKRFKNPITFWIVTLTYFIPLGLHFVGIM